MFANSRNKNRTLNVSVKLKDDADMFVKFGVK